MSPVIFYHPYTLTDALKGAGDVIGQTNETSTEPAWQATSGRHGEVSKGSKADAFLKYALRPNTRYPTDPVIPAGSTINSSFLRVVPSVVGSGTMTIRAGCLTRFPNANALGNNYYGPISASWNDDDPAFVDTRTHIKSDILNNSSRVDDQTAREVQSPADTPHFVMQVDKLGVAGDENIAQVCMENRIVTLNGDGDAEFDEVTFGLMKVNSPSAEQVWVEVWDKPPIDVNTPDPTGEMFAASARIDISTLSTGLAVVQFLFSTTVIGPGARSVHCWLRDDATTHLYNVDNRSVNNLAVKYVSRRLGGGDGFLPFMYQARAALPGISIHNTDVTKPANLFGSLSPEFVITGWQPSVFTDILDLQEIVQEWVDDPGYTEGDNIGIVVEGLNSGAAGNRWWGLEPSALLSPPRLQIDFTALAPPVVDTFTATRSSIPIGASTLLAWTTSDTNAPGVSIDNGIGVVSDDGSLIATPTVTTTYTITASNGFIVDTSEVTVTVTPLTPPAFTVSETSIANASLMLLGERRINSLNEGSVTAAIIADRYDDLRDALLRLLPWNFATERVSLSADPTAPVWGHGNAYTLPTDFIRLLEVDDGTLRLPYSIEGKKIVTSLGPPLDIVYTKRVVDPSQMEPLFRDCLSAFIAVELAEAVTGDSEKLQQVFGIFQRRFMMAGAVNGQEDEPLRVIATEWQAARGRDEER